MAKATKLYTPAAPSKFVYLNKPDTRYNKDGKYKASLVFDQDEPFVKMIDEEAKAAFEEAKVKWDEEIASLPPRKRAQAEPLKYHDPVRDEEDSDGELTGNVLIDFSTVATIKDRKTGEMRPVKLSCFDASGKRVDRIPNVGSGTVMVICYKPKVNVTQGTFYYTLYLNAFQIIELVEFGGSYDGFKAKEGGWTGGADDGAPNAGEEAPGAPGAEDDF